MQILTNSNIGLFKNCRQAFYYRNVEYLVPRIESTARGIGTAVHKGIETGSIEDALATFDDVFPNDQAEADALETNKVIVQAMLEGYFERFGVGFPDAEEYYPETQFEIDVVNPKTGAKSKTFKLAGKADGLLKQDGKWWVVEYKTAGQVGKSYIDKLMLDSQMTTYIYGLQRQRNIKIAGVIYRVIRKPSIRQTAKETLYQFLDRLIADYKVRPEFYFFNEKLYRSQVDLKKFESELWALTQDVLKCQREGLYYKNTSRCQDWSACEYMPLCLQQPDARDMFVSRIVNSELEEEVQYGSIAS